MENNTQTESAHLKDGAIVINGHHIVITESEPTGAQILTAGAFEPADEHVLIEMAKIGSRVIALDQRVRVAEHDTGEFFAFRSDEVFTLTVDGHGFQWGRQSIKEPELRHLARVAPEDVLLLERGDEEPILLSENDVVELRGHRTEHLRTEKRLITVFLDNVAKEIRRGVYTTGKLIAELGVRPGYLLNLAERGGLKRLEPGELIKVKPGMRFFSQVPGGGAS